MHSMTCFLRALVLFQHRNIGTLKVLHAGVRLCIHFEQEQKFAEPDVVHPELKSAIRYPRRADKHTVYRQKPHDQFLHAVCSLFLEQKVSLSLEILLCQHSSDDCGWQDGWGSQIILSNSWVCKICIIWWIIENMLCMHDMENVPVDCLIPLQWNGESVSPCHRRK